MPHFTGFLDDDFETLKGSAWRGRDALGGVLARALRSQLGADCESWGVRRRLELHVAKRSRYAFTDPRPLAKLVVYTHNDLVFGFYVEAKSNKDVEANYVHWRQFRDRVRGPSRLRQAIEAAIETHDLLFTDYGSLVDGNKAPLGAFASQGGKMRYSQSGSDGWTDSSLDEFADAVASPPRDKWVNVHIVERISRQDAIKMGSAIVERILSVLEALAPVYLETIASTGPKAT